jgi:DMSO/TMAO reductase YedYZ molybdopterin-dependent catalytic subunit
MEKLTREQLPPGQVWGKKWVIYAFNGIPKVTAAEWRLKVTGLVEKPLEYTYEEFSKLPMESYIKSFHCLVPNSIVYANPEPLRIADVKVGTRIIGMDGRRHAVKRLITKQHDGDVIGVKASYLPPALMTPEHPVWTVNGHPGVGKSKSKRRLKTFEHGVKAEWKRADELKKGDYVYFPRYRYSSNARHVKFNGHVIPLDEGLAELVGWYVAEGSGADSDFRGIAFALNADEVQEGERIMKLLRDIFGSTPHTYSNERGTLLRIVATSSRLGKLAPMFKTWCGADAESKKIPDFILNAPEDLLKSFLRSLLSGDGYSPVFKGKTGVGTDFIDITTSSTMLAYQLILAFSKVGIAAEMVNHPGSVKDAHSIRVLGAAVQGLLPDFPVRDRIDRSHYKKTEEGFYLPITKIWKEHYKGTVHDFQAPGYTMLSPFATKDCVTRWSIERPLWEGVPIKYLADTAGVKPEATWVMFHCYDGYTAPIPVGDALREDSIVALKMNGSPLLPEQGFPARPFMPHLYGWKSAKWLKEIEFIPEYMDGYWEMYGYHERGDVDTEERFKGDGYKPVARRAFGTV